MSHLDTGEPDDCQRCLLTIVARGTAIITEIYRLVELIPEPFQEECRQQMSKQQRSMIEKLICDFSYFKNADDIEALIESSPKLKLADEQFCEDHGEILVRFYLTFEAVQRQANDLQRFLLDIEDEVFIGQTLDRILTNHEALQLLCEAHFQIGYMLLLLDKNFDGDLRERLIVSYYRYSAYKLSPDTNLDETCNLMRATGYKCHQQKCYSANKSSGDITYRPDVYPESLFARVAMDQSIISALIAKLSTVDIYHQTSTVYPHSDHRSNALSLQASILYILLYFCPNILKSQRSRMREITDKFFSDNWVVHIFMGEMVNLIEMWDPYRAARESLLQIHEIESVKTLTAQFIVRFNRNFKLLTDYLKEGWLDIDSFIEHNSRILNCIRDSNVTLKWLMLHSEDRIACQTNKLIKSLSSVVRSSLPDPGKMCEFFQNLCVLEKKVGALFDQVTAIRAAKLVENRAKACDMLDELVCIFNDTKPMRWVEVGANQGLARILSEILSQLAEMNLEDTIDPSSREATIRLISRIESAKESYSDGKSLQVVQLFKDTKESLVRSLRYLDFTGDFKTTLQAVCDFGYGWTLMDEIFTESIQRIIKNNPETLADFEAVIIKLTISSESQLVRLQQVGAQSDLISVSQYYSTKMVIYVGKVLQIIPATILELISELIANQSSSNLVDKSLPSRIHLDQLREYAMPEQRLQILQITCKISHYAKGIMTMPSTAIGLKRIDSRQMLEDGFSRELYNSLSNQIQAVVSLDPVKQSNQLISRLCRLDTTLNMFKSSVEYVQDFLKIYGLKMWQEELNRLVDVSVEQAILSIELSRQNHQSSSDNTETKSTRTAFTKPLIPPTNSHLFLSALLDSNSESQTSNFMLRILDELLRITNPRNTIYDDQSSVWFDSRRQQRVLDATRMLRLLGSSLGVSGLNGLDRLCSSLLVTELENLRSCFVEEPSQTNQTDTAEFTFTKLFEGLEQVRNHKWLLLESLNEERLKHLMLSMFFASLNQRSSANPSAVSSIIMNRNKRLVDHLLSIGQLQIFRTNIQRVLSTNCRSDARNLFGCLTALNSALLATVQIGKGAPNQQKTLVDSPVDKRLSLDETQTNQRSFSASISESQLVFELTNYLEWIGLSDPESKIYTLALQRDRLGTTISQSTQNVGQEVDGSIHPLCHTVLEHCSKLQYISLISPLPMRPTKSQALNSYLNAVDEQPLYYGIVALLNHIQPNLLV